MRSCVLSLAGELYRISQFPKTQGEAGARDVSNLLNAFARGGLRMPAVLAHLAQASKWLT